jgi:hypothetical protein
VLRTVARSKVPVSKCAGSPSPSDLPHEGVVPFPDPDPAREYRRPPWPNSYGARGPDGSERLPRHAASVSANVSWRRASRIFHSVSNLSMRGQSVEPTRSSGRGRRRHTPRAMVLSGQKALSTATRKLCCTHNAPAIVWRAPRRSAVTAKRRDCGPGTMPSRLRIQPWLPDYPDSRPVNARS